MDKEILYHGSTTKYIDVFEPQKRFTPGEAVVEPRIYATDLPVFAAMHAFPWSSDEGIDIMFDTTGATLKIPEKYITRLEQPVYIYRLPKDNFIQTPEEKTDHTFHSLNPVQPLGVLGFESVTQAIQHYKGHIVII
jgi:hypothetical protein